MQRQTHALSSVIIKLALIATLCGSGISFGEPKHRPDVDVNKPASKSIFSYGDGATAQVEDDVPEEYPEPTKTRKKRARHVEDDEAEDTSAPSSGRWGFAGGLGMGSGFFGAALSVAYYWNRFIAIDTNGFYRSEKTEDWSKIHYGPEVDLKLMAANPTIFVPFVGAGPGYEKWVRTYKDDRYNEASSLTSNYFAGVDFRLMRNFHLLVSRKTTTYLGTPPIAISDRKTEEPKTFSRLEIQFQLSLQ